MAIGMLQGNEAILRLCQVLEPASDAELERLAARGRRERYRRGARVAPRNGIGTPVFVLAEGRLKATIASMSGDGELLVGVVRPGDLFGDLQVADGPLPSPQAFAVTETEVLLLPREELLALCDRCPAVAQRWMTATAERLRAALDLAVILRFSDVPSRFHARLVDLARHDAVVHDGLLRIEHGLSQQELADSIGSSREVLNKVIADWKRDGLLEWGRGFVTLKDPTRLAARVSSRGGDERTRRRTAA